MSVDGQDIGKNSWAFYVKSVEKRWIPSTIVDKAKYPRHVVVLDLLLDAERRYANALAANSQSKANLQNARLEIFHLRRSLVSNLSAFEIADVKN